MTRLHIQNLPPVVKSCSWFVHYHRAVFLVIGAVLLGWTLAGGQTAIERMGGSIGGRAPEPSEAEKFQAKMRHNRAETQRLAEALNNTNNYRLVDGTLYNVALSTNWVSLPGPHHIGKFVRQTNGVAFFALEKRMSSQWGTGLTQRSVWYEPDREVGVKNLPAAASLGGSMPQLRVLPIGQGIYDHGVRPNSTNSLTTNEGPN
jgi:hypothetical protein